MDKDEGRIERLKRTLYSRDESVVPKEKRTPVGGREFDVPTNWGTSTSYDVSFDDMAKNNNSFFNKFLIGAVAFFVLALGVAFFIFFGGLNMISSNNLDIKIIAPTTISSGENILANLTIVNSNRTDLENVTLFIDYPEGSQEAVSPNKVLTHQQINLGSIPQGGNKEHSISCVLFGEKDVIKTFNLRLEYKVKGSNAVFSKEKVFEVIIGSSPILLNIDYPKEMTSGQEVKFTMNITSNTGTVLKDTLIKVDYPYGFTYKDSNIKPLRDNSVWNIGDLKNGDQKVLTITGVLIGQNMEDRSFRISAGTGSTNTSKDFDTPLVESSITVGIRKSFFDLAVSSSGGPVASAGQAIPVTVGWQNTLPDKIINNKIEASISGNAFNRNVVSVGGGGFYQSLTNSVIWDKNKAEKLGELLPGDGGEVTFSPMSFPDNAQTRTVKNPHIDVHVVMSGDRSGLEAGVVTSIVDYTIKILSTVNLTAQSFRNVGPFANSGPIPPRADNETTYTITWTMTNTTNDLKNTVVSTTLPPGVSWKGETSPLSERISYNNDTNTISWNVGNVSAGAGFTFSPRTVSFKVAIIPSINQITSSPDLISNTKLHATDTYTVSPIDLIIQSVTTQYSDPGYKSGDSVVQK